MVTQSWSKTLVIRTLEGVISTNTALNRQELREFLFAGSELGTTTWKGLEIDAGFSQGTRRGEDCKCYWARVPLKPESIEIMVLSPKAGWEELAAFAARLLESLEGPTNWETPGES
jgi:hypothetical protein